MIEILKYLAAFIAGGTVGFLGAALCCAAGRDAVRACRVCGCTDEWGCAEGCWWVEADLCSSCVPTERGVPV
jgi:hypothetical protein